MKRERERRNRQEVTSNGINSINERNNRSIGAQALTSIQGNEVGSRWGGWNGFAVNEFRLKRILFRFQGRDGSPGCATPSLTITWS